MQRFNPLPSFPEVLNPEERLQFRNYAPFLRGIIPCFNVEALIVLVPTVVESTARLGELIP